MCVIMCFIYYDACIIQIVCTCMIAFPISCMNEMRVSDMMCCSIN